MHLRQSDDVNQTLSIRAVPPTVHSIRRYQPDTVGQWQSRKSTRLAFPSHVSSPWLPVETRRVDVIPIRSCDLRGCPARSAVVYCVLWFHRWMDFSLVLKSVLVVHWLLPYSLSATVGNFVVENLLQVRFMTLQNNAVARTQASWEGTRTTVLYGSKQNRLVDWRVQRKLYSSPIVNYPLFFLVKRTTFGIRKCFLLPNACK